VNITKQLKRDEGLRLNAYKCTAGVWTIGYGHTGNVQEGDTITEAEATKLLECDIAKSLSQVLHRIPWANKLDEVRFYVLVNMCFNLGIDGLLKFKNTLKYVEDGDYKQSAINMLNSLWAKQVKNRAIRLAKQMETGEWQ